MLATFPTYEKSPARAEKFNVTLDTEAERICRIIK